MKKNIKKSIKIILLISLSIILALNVSSFAEYDNVSKVNVEDLVSEYENVSDVNLDLVKEETENIISNETIINDIVNEEESVDGYREIVDSPSDISREFENQGTQKPTLSIENETNQDYKNINFILACYMVILILIILLFIYLISKVVSYFKANKEYKKAIEEGKEAEKPIIAIKVKYIVLLILILDILIFGLVFVMNTGI